MQNSEHDRRSDPAQVTVITSTRPATLSKTAWLRPDRTVERGGGGQLAEGHASIVEVPALADLAALLKSLGPANALSFGIPRGGDGPVLSRALYRAHGGPPNATTRTRSEFAWPDGPGVMMLDHDPGAESLTREALVETIRSAAPGLADAAMLWWPSASSHLCDVATGEDLTGLRGQRLYLMVSEAADIPRAGKALVDRLWAAGLGRILVSAAGSALERCPIDASVWQPERLDFAAGSVCRAGLEQRRGKPVPIPGVARVIDTRAAIPDDPKISGDAARARKKARHEVADALNEARDAWLDRQADAMLPGGARGDEGARDEARAIARRAVERQVLEGSFPIEVETAPGRFETVTIEQVLANRDVYHGRLTRDPLEPGYDAGRTVGKLFLRDARPALFSFAHGGCSFRLVRGLSRVEIVQGRMAEATEAALEYLRSDPVIFDFGGAVALVDAGQPVPLDEHALANHLGGLLQFWKSRKIGGDRIETVDVDPPARLIRQILSLGPRRGLKPLDAIVTAATLRPDGSLLAEPGYDRETRLLLEFDDAYLPMVPASPGAEQAAEALARLMHPFSEFPVLDAQARGALLAALLTATVRASLPTAPAFAVDAPVQGSGKTLLASCIASLATGEAPEIWPHTAGRDDEEVRKRLLTALRSGTTALVWDNVTGVLDSAALAGAITAPILRDRVLGRSESLGAPNRAMLIFTGNNLCPAGDLARRVIPIRIDPGSEAPFGREFDLDPMTHVRQHRHALIGAALILIRGWLTSRAPRARGRLASFELWDDLVRQTVCWIDGHVAPGLYGDPMALIMRLQRSDPEQEMLFALLDALAETFGSGWFTAKEVGARAQRGLDPQIRMACEAALAEAIIDIAGDRAVRSTRSIGKMLKFRDGRIALGRRIVCRDGPHHHRFRVETVQNSEEGGHGRFDRFGRFVSDGSEPMSETGSGTVNREGPGTNRPNRPNRQRGRIDDPESR